MAMSTAWEPDWVLRPGEVIADYLTELGGSVEALARASELPTSVLEGIVNDDGPITEDIARSLYRGTGLSPEFWLNLERNYRTGLAAGKTVL